MSNDSQTTLSPSATVPAAAQITAQLAATHQLPLRKFPQHNALPHTEATRLLRGQSPVSLLRCWQVATLWKSQQ